MKKECIECLKTKPISEYYAHKQMKDGHLNKCKECVKNNVKKRHHKLSENPEWVESERMRHKEKYVRLGYKEKQLEWDANRPWTRTSTYKNLRRNIDLKGAIGAIQGLSSTAGYELHHWSYNHLTEVFLLSSSQHKKLHAEITFSFDDYIFSYNNKWLDSSYAHAQCAMRILKKQSIRFIYKDGDEYKLRYIYKA